MDALRPGREFDGYRLVKLLGQGGMGAVYLAEDSQLERSVAVKFILTEEDPSAKKRFMVEARAVARLQHPNVVSIYGVGEVDGMPYIVSEFIRGTPLDKAELPVSYAHALKLGIGVSRGLCAAHRRGVIHRDIKPANVILSDDGEVKLLDFGIAKLMQGAAEGPLGSLQPPDVALIATLMPDEVLKAPFVGSATQVLDMTWAGETKTEGGVSVHLTSDDVLLGTPQFLAPELWLGEPADFQSDIYSLGMLLFAVCSGRPAFVGENLLSLRNKIVTSDAVPLLEIAPHVDPRFAEIVDRCLSRDRRRRFQTVQEVRNALERLQHAVPVGEQRSGNPYRGLFAFEAEHKDLFFGRDAEIRAVLERLETETFVIAVGDSGVGKSSLLRAGVLPRLLGPGGEANFWQTVCIVPGRYPLAALSATLAPFFMMSETEVERRLAEDPGSAARVLRAALRSGGRGIALLLDQLEELTTLSDRSEVETVCLFLEHLVMPSANLRVLASARSDFVGRLAALPRFGQEISRSLVFIHPLSPEAVRAAITGPAEMSGVTFESQALVDELASAAEGEGGALPLLQFTLAELWSLRDKEKATISKAALDRLGGVLGALTGHADRVLHEMLPKVRGAARTVLMRLVTVEGTRARKSANEVCEGLPDGPAALESLVRGRLLTASSSHDEPMFEIAHEYLIRGWHTLAGWLSRDADRRQTVLRLQSAAREWERLGKSRQALWGDKQLSETMELSLVELPQLEQSFVLKSKRAGMLRRVRFALAVLSVPVAALLIWGSFRLNAEHNIRLRVDRHLKEADAMLAEASDLQKEAREARLQAMAAFDGFQSENGEALLAAFEQKRRKPSALRQKASEQLEAALMLSPTREDVRARFASLLYERAILAEEMGATREKDELLSRLALYDTGGVWQGKWSASGKVVFEVDPKTAKIALAVYRETGDKNLTLSNEEDISVEDAPRALSQGSYRATISAEDRISVFFPFTVGRGETVRVRVVLPKMLQIPSGFVYVPPGRFSFGSAAEENLRRDFFHTVPIHPLKTEGFLVSRNETTFSDWFEYLTALAAEERTLRLPRVESGGFQGSLSVQFSADGSHSISFQPTSVSYSAKVGEPVQYSARAAGSRQDWLRFPVFGISVEDALAYVSWLRASGRVPGARLCTDWEWERAARGADEREYPHGGRLLPSDANFDATYGRKSAAMGPDEIGSHPASDSPFGISDMAGNVWEWTVSSLKQGEFAARGGSYLFGANTARVTEREITEPAFRDVSVGMRVCADAPL